MSDFSSQLSLMREQYDRNPLRRAELSSCPIEQFELWLSEVVTAKLYDPNACSLSTVASDGQPVARAVLLKGVESGEFIFYTNFNSRKARHLSANPRACMHFPWFALQRQVIVTGRVEKVADDIAEEYFISRPYFSRLGAWASEQSEDLDSRESLKEPFYPPKKSMVMILQNLPIGGGFSYIRKQLNFGRADPIVCMIVFFTKRLKIVGK